MGGTETLTEYQLLRVVGRLLSEDCREECTDRQSPLVASQLVLSATASTQEACRLSPAVVNIGYYCETVRRP